jgi:AraC-like DNA-binding protein
MSIVRYRPRAPLDGYVKWLWWSSRDVPQPAGEHMLPCASAQLIFALDDQAYTWRSNSSAQTPTSWRQGVLHGPQWSYFLSGPKLPGAVAGAAFHTGAAAAVLGIPMTEVTDGHVPIDALWGSYGLSIRQRLLEAGDPMAVLRTLEGELMARIQRPLRMHPAVAQVLAEPVRGWGFARISDLQRQSGYSPRHFIALFRNAVGLTPKHYYRQRRFKAALRTLARNAGPSLAELAASLGYADQSHLTREFRGLAGITPTQYRPRDPDSVLHHIATGPPPPRRGGKISSIHAGDYSAQ